MKKKAERKTFSSILSMKSQEGKQKERRFFEMEREEIKMPEQGKETKCKKKWNKEKIIATALPWVLCAMVVCIQLGGNIVLADEKDLMKTALKWIAYIGMFLGVVYFIVGAIHYAAAHSEGDGPAKQKAQGQIASAVMIFAICGLASSDATLSTILNYISKPK